MDRMKRSGCFVTVVCLFGELCQGISATTGEPAADERDGNDWKRLVIADRKASIPDTAAFRIDFEQWLRTLDRRNQRIIDLMMAGEPGIVVAERFGISPARVSHLR